jgi:hypothetical protein
VGVEEGLLGQVEQGHLTGSELRSRFESWIATWAVRQASETRAWRARAEALEREVGRRDERLAAIVQAKDAEIARLEGQLVRLNRLPPLRLYQAVRRRLAGILHNTSAEAQG